MAVLAIAALMLCLTAGLSSAATVELPQTGQTTCYDTSGNVIPCSNTGQDGEIKAGAAWPPSRFTDNGDGTVTDTLTGLVWLKNANCANAAMTWAQALADVTKLNNNGTMNGNNCGDTSNGGSHQTDWRLPNVNELESLIHAGEANTASWLNSQGFSNVQYSWYWSSTTNASGTDSAWGVNMLVGCMLVGYKATNNISYVWPVRSGVGAATVELPQTGQTTCYDTSGNVIPCSNTGQDGEIKAGAAWPSPRFTDNGDGTVTDTLTGLVWLKNADCANAQRTWTQALADVTGLNTSGTMNGNNCGDTSNGGSNQTDWRLPNRKELRSLIDYSKYSPALQTGHPFSNVSNWYWSSTTYANYTGSAWYVYMNGGHVDAGNKVFSFYVWPVRGGLLYNLAISKVGTGTGTVTSDSSGINCGADCSESYDTNTVVTLTPIPDTGSTFAGWSGNCSGVSVTNVTMDANKTCTATFTLNTYTITATGAGVDGGTIKSGSIIDATWNGTTTGGDNTETVNYGTGPYTITATVTVTGVNVTWSGDCDATTGNGTTTADCTINSGIAADKNITATFTLTTSVTIPSATGNGNITIETNTPGCGLYNVSVKTEAQVANDPSYDYPYGLLEFNLNCADTYVTITYPGNIPQTYRKYGPTTPGDPSTTQWYTFNDVTYPSGNQVTLHLRDGQLGDDTVVDGIIVDQGGPGQQPQQQPQAVSVPTMNEWGMILFITITGIVSVCYLRRGRLS